MTISRRALCGKLNLTLFRGIESATAFARLRGHPHVELAHWIHQLWQINDSDLQRVCRHCQIDAQAVEKDLASALSVLPSRVTSLIDHPDVRRRESGRYRRSRLARRGHHRLPDRLRLISSSATILRSVVALLTFRRFFRREFS